MAAECECAWWACGMWWLRNRLRSWRGPSRCFMLFTLTELDWTLFGCSGGVLLPGGVVFVDGIDGSSLASEPRRGEALAGVMASNPWLAFRAENGKREDDDEDGGCDNGGSCSADGEAGAES